ncbi:MAG: FtsQ-type POTRA domain-containing protein, partial [Rhizomicrobium sp.]
VILSVVALVIIILISGVIGRTIRAVDEAVAATLIRSGFGISSIDIAGTGHTTNADVRTALGFAVGVPVFYADLYGARERLLGLPWVADATVRRIYPGKIDVAVVEKVPYARWQTYGGTYVVDRLGRTITNRDTEKFSHLPLLWGAAAPQVAAGFIEAVRRHPAIASRVLAYHYQSERRWNLVLNGFVTVKLPEYGWQKELDELERLIVSNDILSRSLNEIDLRSPTFYYFGNVPVQRQTEVPPGTAVANPPDAAVPPKTNEEGRAI